MPDRRRGFRVDCRRRRRRTGDLTNRVRMRQRGVGLRQRRRHAPGSRPRCRSGLSTRMSEPLAWVAVIGGGPRGGRFRRWRMCRGAQRASRGEPAIERAGPEPSSIGRRHGFSIVIGPSHQSAGQREGQFRIIRRLARERVPGAAVAKLRHASRIVPRDVGGGTKLDKRAETVTDDLTKQAPSGPIQHRFRHRPRPVQPHPRFSPGLGAAAPGARPQHRHRGLRPAETRRWAALSPCSL